MFLKTTEFPAHKLLWNYGYFYCLLRKPIRVRMYVTISLKLNKKIRDMFLQSDVSFFTSETPETNKTKTSIKPIIEWKEIRGKSGYRNM